MEKVIVGRRGDTLKVECLEDDETGEGYFLIRDSAGRTVKASEIKMGNVVFTMDESKRTFSKHGLEYELFLHIAEMVGETNHRRIPTKDIASSFWEKMEDLGFRGISARMVGKICRALGFRVERTGVGYAVVVEPQDMQAAGAKFTLQEE